MSWTVACFCGTVFESPTDRCPTCNTPVPEVTRGADVTKPVISSRRRRDGARIAGAGPAFSRDDRREHDVARD